MKKEKPLFVFYSQQITVLIIGTVLIINFFVVYFISAYFTKQIDFLSYLYHNISKNILIMIPTGLLVGMLGVGILLCISAFFNMSPVVFCYKDRFVIYMYLQKKRVIYFDKIDKITQRVYYNNYENLFKKYPKKECRVTFLNQVYDFYMSYPVEGYFDDIEIFLTNKMDDSSRRCVADYKSIHEIFTRIKLYNPINLPYLPKEKLKGE
jgi:hypothetical protein